MGLLTGLALGAVGAGGAVVAAPFVLGAIGFGTIGVTAGSYAAAWMSSAAIASGGGIVSGSAVSVLTSLGMGGLGTAATAGVAGAGGAVGTALGLLI
ncbi:interferon alpha-inducible protein 27-like protein 2 isoform X1 [Cynoglossus semilaevis]|uniref:interferon alpha-inducible protein 27-like protein 2 isoform X1 n=1 Tax=Cynoglossus semilaevis TaxID=244447 RepID=UPI000497E3AB|nr:interferon alpha-inducible protein 27-like protein 2 isoform X1 [Cynoglossus semilaevis]